jgi:glyoxalase family protein
VSHILIGTPEDNKMALDLIPGIHHVTAICSDPQTNIDFYTRVLGLRLVKLTVNFDDPSSYHLYYGDEVGRPGTILTFFASPGVFRARHGKRSVATTALSVPPGSLEFWKQHFTSKQVAYTTPIARFGEEVLQFHDPDGLVLEIIASERALMGHAWRRGGIPEEYAIRGVHSITIAAEGYEHTAQLLTGPMHFKIQGEAAAVEPNRSRFVAHEGIGAIVDIACVPDAPRSTTGAGGVHHIAFRIADASAQLRVRATLVRDGFNVSPVMDRSYFESIYFREPGGVLFEIATDTPGFTVDEDVTKLGTKLKLPSWLETYREQIEQQTLPLKLPGASS